LSVRLLEAVEEDVDRILLAGAEKWGLDAAVRYNKLMLAVLGAIGASPALHGSKAVPGVDGVWAYHLRLGRHLVKPGDRAVRPRHVVIYRIGRDGVAEIIGLAHERMLLVEAARRLQGQAGPSS